MSQSKKPKADFSDMSFHDVVAMIMNTAVVAKESGHGVNVRNATVAGVPSIVVVMPGYRFEDGRLQKAESAVAAGE